MKKLLILLLIPFLSFQSFSQTDEVDRLKKIWIDDMIEFGDISIKNIDWNAVFVPYYLERRINKNTNKYPYKTIELDVERFLTAIGIQTGTYYRKKTAKDTNNREMTLSTNRIARGRYWVDIEGLFNGIYPTGFVYNITDSKNNFITVGNIKIDTRTETFKSWKKARNKYVKKYKIDKRRVKSYSQVVWEEILKKYKNTKQIKRTPNVEYGKRGVEKSQNGDYEGAIADFQKAIELDPNNANAYYAIGVIKVYFKKDYYGAISDFNKAIELDPNNANNAKVYANRGVAKELIGDLNGACTDWKKAANLNDEEAKKWVADKCK